MSRVFPTGKCFCGCGEPTEGTSYFVAGHDKRAEAKVVKEVYGSVVEFLAAHGYGPEGRDPEAALGEDIDAKGLQLLQKWSKVYPNVHVDLEVLSTKDRGGPRERQTRFHVEYLPKDRAFVFDRCRDAPHMKLTVPVPDIAWVYLERNPQRHNDSPLPVVRLRGAITGEPARFQSFG
jgi:hypothetical protein